MKPLGIILVIVGIVGLLYGGITYKHEKTVLDVGPIKATATEHKRIPFPPTVGVIALVAGVALLVIPNRRRTA